jgi:ABC-type multidrug transport system fused ATPase/permease subunit
LRQVTRGDRLADDLAGKLALSGVVSNIVSLVLALAAMLWLSWPVTVAAVALIPLFLIPARPGLVVETAGDGRRAGHAPLPRSGTLSPP